MITATQTDSTRSIFVSIFLTLLLIAGVFFSYAGNGFAEGQAKQVSYQELWFPATTLNPEKIEIRAVYAYNCDGCYEFHRMIDGLAFTLPEDVVLKRSPLHSTTHHNSNQLSSQLTAQANGLDALFLKIEATEVSSQLHEVVFESLMAGQDLWQDIEKQETLFSEYGVAKETFSLLADPATLAKKIRTNAAQQKIYRVSQVPAIIINGKYLMDGSSLKDSEQLTQAMEILLERERVVKN